MSLSDALDRLRAHRGLVFDGAFTAAILLISPFLAGAFRDVIHGAANRPLAILLVVGMVLELVGIHIKLLSASGRDDALPLPIVRSTFLWALHVLASAALFVLIYLASGKFEDNLVIGAEIFIGMKEGYILLLFLFVKAKGPALRIQFPPAAQLAGDLCLVFFAVVSYAAIWQSGIMAPDDDVSKSARKDGPGFAVLLGTEIFLLVYMPTRMTFFMEEWMTVRSARTRLIQWAFLAQAVIVGTFRLYISHW